MPWRWRRGRYFNLTTTSELHGQEPDITILCSAEPIRLGFSDPRYLLDLAFVFYGEFRQLWLSIYAVLNSYFPTAYEVRNNFFQFPSIPVSACYPNRKILKSVVVGQSRLFPEVLAWRFSTTSRAISPRLLVKSIYELTRAGTGPRCGN